LKTLRRAIGLSALVSLALISAAGQQAPDQSQGSSTPLAQPTQAESTANAVPEPLEHWSIQPLYWLTTIRPYLRGGAAAPDYENLDYPGKGQSAPGVLVSFPISRTTNLVFSGFITKGASDSIAPQDLDLFGTDYSAGDYLVATYKITNLKLSLEDLFFPFPRKEGQKWRIKSLWEVQYTRISTSVDAPLAPTTSSSGAPVDNLVTGSRSVVYPSFGLAGEYHLTKHLELDGYASGFAIPHHDTIGDTEGSIGYRIGAVELIAGGKYYHFKTSPQNAEYFKTTLWGPFASIRWYPQKFSVPCPFCPGRSTTAKNGGGQGGQTTSAPSSSGASGAAGQNAPASGAGTSSSSSSTDYGNYVRRASGGVTLSVLGFSLIPNSTTTVNTSSTVSTQYATTGASSRIGYGVTGQVALTDHFAIAAQGILRRIGYQLDTTVTTSSTTNGITSTSTTSTHEDTRADLIDVPAVVRYYNKSRHAPGPRWFVEAGGVFRDARSVRTSLSSTDSSGNLTCCTFTPTEPAHRISDGVVAGAGLLLIDPLGIRIIPEVQYSRWIDQTFALNSTRTQRNEIAAGISISF